jgi:hypothetical protein
MAGVPDKDDAIPYLSPSSAWRNSEGRTRNQGRVQQHFQVGIPTQNFVIGGPQKIQLFLKHFYSGNVIYIIYYITITGLI